MKDFFRIFSLVVFSFYFLFLTQSVSAEKIVLKNGNIINGQIVRETEDAVWVKIAYRRGTGEITIKKDELHSIGSKIFSSQSAGLGFSRQSFSGGTQEISAAAEGYSLFTSNEHGVRLEIESDFKRIKGTDSYVTEDGKELLRINVLPGSLREKEEFSMSFSGQMERTKIEIFGIDSENIDKINEESDDFEVFSWIFQAKGPPLKGRVYAIFPFERNDVVLHLILIYSSEKGHLIDERAEKLLSGIRFYK
ncbi:MAG: hypothetical protein ABH872_01905 [Candidatus Omnitrophota bacterium]